MTSIICKNCNANITSTTNYCPYCGTQIRKIIVAPRVPLRPIISITKLRKKTSRSFRNTKRK